MSSTLVNLTDWDYHALGGGGLRPFHDPYAIAFFIGKYPIVWYAILSIIGYLLAIVIYLITLKVRYKANVDVGFYYIFVGMPMILFGARFWSCLMGNSPWEQFFDFWRGGMAIQGGVVFGALSALIYFGIILRFPKYHKRIVENGKVYIKRPSMWIYADAIIPTILIGQAVGRWGNYFNGNLFGLEVSPEGLYWLKAIMPGVYEHMQATQTVYQTVNGVLQPVVTIGDYYQPLFLYSSFAGVLSFIILYLIMPPFRSIKIGSIASLYFVFYGFYRYILETQRNIQFRFVATLVLNGILLGMGILMFIYTQFIGPKLRKYKLTKYFIYLIKSKFTNAEVNSKTNNKKSKQVNKTNAVVNNTKSVSNVNGKTQVVTQQLLKTNAQTQPNQNVVMRWIYKHQNGLDKFTRSEAEMFYYAGR